MAEPSPATTAPRWVIEAERIGLFTYGESCRGGACITCPRGNSFAPSFAFRVLRQEQTHAKRECSEIAGPLRLRAIATIQFRLRFRMTDRQARIEVSAGKPLHAFTVHSFGKRQQRECEPARSRWGGNSHRCGTRSAPTGGPLERSRRLLEDRAGRHPHAYAFRSLARPDTGPLGVAKDPALLPLGTRAKFEEALP